MKFSIFTFQLLKFSTGRWISVIRSRRFYLMKFSIFTFHLLKFSTGCVPLVRFKLVRSAVDSQINAIQTPPSSFRSPSPPLNLNVEELKMEDLPALLSSTQMWTVLASAMAVHAFFQRFLYTITPLITTITDLVRRLLGRAYSQFSFDIPEYEGKQPNALYEEIHLYLSGISSLSTTTTRLTLTRSRASSTLTSSLSSRDTLTDVFDGATVTWAHAVTSKEQSERTENHSYTLSINKLEKHLILPAYFDHIKDRTAELRHLNRQRYLYTNSHGGWSPVPLKHPSTFETLALEPSMKDNIMADLREFANNGGAFYQRTGRAWKRGYLLYGPPGTGKSSMIAAMANYLSYDIYDLELTQVPSNSELLKLLMRTNSNSIIVIEDIDCSIDLPKRTRKPARPSPYDFPRKPSVTLSGLLNLTDGLWSSYGIQKIFVFTTNHIENIDPALLRSGRMDMHIEMGNCTFLAMKILMKNYWGLEEVDGCDMLMEEIEGVIKEAEITPADVSEVLTRNRRKEKKKAVEELLQVLKERAELKSKRGEESLADMKEPTDTESEGVVNEVEGRIDGEEVPPGDGMPMRNLLRKKKKKKAVEELLETLKEALAECHC